MFYSSPHWDATERGRWLRLVAVAYLKVYQVTIVFGVDFFSSPQRDATERGRWLRLVAVAYLNIYQVTIVFEIECLFISSLGCY